MNPIASYHRIYDTTFARLKPLDGVPPLLLRLFLAPVMIQSGWVKAVGFGGTVSWFGETLGMPLPALMAFLATAAELGGGIMLLAGLWGLIFNGFPYAIAFKTGNVAAVNLSFLLFFPFLFMTTLFIPQEQMTPWLSTTADFNPVTYILAAERSLITEGWQWGTIRNGIVATLGVGVVSLGLALYALRGRATRK